MFYTQSTIALKKDAGMQAKKCVTGQNDVWMQKETALQKDVCM